MAGRIAMASQQGNVSLLNEPLAQELLQSTIPARLAYTARDGSPRVVPIWFQWNGTEVVMGTPANAPKVRELTANPRVALTIDGDVFPHKVLMVRGPAALSTVDGVVAEYEQASHRYFGAEEGQKWCDTLRAVPGLKMSRIAVKPEWVGLLDFQTRFPSAIAPLFTT
jgi:Pyridoxamine 5'-phosphate oxidase